MKFSGEAEARDKQKNFSKSMLIKILDGMAMLYSDNFKEAAIRLANVNLIEDPSIYQICTPTDLAFYITLCSLQSLDRKSLRT
jgi:hypothetical protein